MNALFEEISKKLHVGWTFNICISSEERWLHAENYITDEMMEMSFDDKSSYEDQIKEFIGRLIEKYHISATC